MLAGSPRSMGVGDEDSFDCCRTQQHSAFISYDLGTVRREHGACSRCE